MRVFPDKKLSSSKLAYIYKRYKIRFKKIGNTKVLTDVQKRRIRFQIPLVRNQMNEHIQRGFRIIYADEMMVTKSSMPTHAWSQKNQRIKVDRWQYHHNPIAVIAGVSEQFGTDLVMLFDFSIDKKKFKVYLDELRSKYFFDDICLYIVFLCM